MRRKLKNLGNARPYEPKAVAKELYTIGRLAQAGVLRKIDNASIIKMIEEIAWGRPNKEIIAGSMFSLGLLCRQQLFKPAGSFERSVEILLERLITLEPDEQELSNTCFGLGVLAHAGVLPDLNKTNIQPLVTKTLRASLNMRMLAANLLSVEHLCSANLVSTIKPEVISLIIDRLHGTSDDFCNALRSLARVARTGVVQALTIPERNKLLDTIAEAAHTDSPKTIATIIYSLGLMAQGGMINAVNNKFISQLLARLLNLPFNAIDISNSIYGLGLMDQALVIPDIDNNLLEQLRNQAGKIDTSILAEDTAHQMLQGVVYCGYTLTENETASLLTMKPKKHYKILNLMSAIQQGVRQVKTIETEKFIGAHFVDLWLELTDGRRIVIELDGKYHDDATNKLRGRDTMRDSYFATQAIQVMRFPARAEISNIITEIKKEIGDTSSPRFFDKAESKPSDFTLSVKQRI